ncbi:hypothetical protein OL98_08805 [Proteus mirabilis]|nr:hypothetical protein OL98_08805 [Proteus mirabilis]
MNYGKVKNESTDDKTLVYDNKRNPENPGYYQFINGVFSFVGSHWCRTDFWFFIGFCHLRELNDERDKFI